MSELEKQIESYRSKPWYPYVSIHNILVSEENRPAWSWVASYKPINDIKKIHFPVLLLFGDSDTENPTQIAVSKWKEGLNRANNRDFTVKIFPGANHGLRIGAHHGPGMGFPKYAEGHLETQLDWLKGNVLKKGSSRN